jgi:hypothetical protein
MTPEPLVDLLLVRLGREEEKKRVSNLLITSLQMTEGDALDAVENSPVVLREAVPMAEARDIQKRLYPFIDLLPRIDETTAPPPPPPVRERDEDSGRGDDKPSYTDDGPIDGDLVGSEYIDAIGTPEADGDDFTSGAVIEYTQSTTPIVEESIETDDAFQVTSASEEMLQIERCHVCGRTPQDGERLAPCRTCGQLTCRDCFDRTVHVCEKCAEEGKVVTSPLQGTPDYLSKHDHHLDQKAEPTAPPPVKDRAGFPKFLIPVGIVLVLAAAFYLVDPMGLFAGEENGGSGTVLPVDSTLTGPDTTVVHPDTTGPVIPDSLEVPPDTALVSSDNPLGVASMTLPDTLVIPGTVQHIPRLERMSIAGVTPMPEDLDAIATQLEQIAAASGISVDEMSLVSINDEAIVILISVLHPEDNTNRYHFLNYLSGFLLGSDVDQIVFYYRENRFQTTSLLTYTSDVFAELTVATSPQHFQQLAGSIGGDVWDLVSGELQDMLTASEQ